MNKRTGGSFMAENEEKSFKLRLRLKNGAEFEAEGSLPFIEKQKEEFFKLFQIEDGEMSSSENYYEQKIIPTNLRDFGVMGQNNAERGDYLTNKTISLDKRKIYTPKTDIWGYPKTPMPQTYRNGEENPAGKYNPEYFGKGPSPRGELRKKVFKKADRPIPRPESSVWDRIAYCEGEYIIIRRKDKNLNSASAALIILGGAKMLRNASKMSALELSKSLKLSGYLKQNERLDRVLAAEIKEGTIVYEGSKRNRGYIITQSGTAKAYTSAERILLNG